MRRFLVLVILATAIVLGRPPTLAGACSCATVSPTEYADDAAVVFAGTWVGDDHEFPEEDPDDAVDRLIHTFVVDRVYKGEVAGEVQVFSNPYSGSCGAAFDDGRYLVYAHRSEHSGDLTTYLCSGNEALGVGDEVPAELGEGWVAAASDTPEGDDAAMAEDRAGAQMAEAVAGDSDDGASTGALVAALGAVGLGLAVVAAAIAWMVVRRRGAA